MSDILDLLLTDEAPEPPVATKEIQEVQPFANAIANDCTQPVTKSVTDFPADLKTVTRPAINAKSPIQTGGHGTCHESDPPFSRRGWEGIPVEPFEPIGPDPHDPFEHPQAGPCSSCGCCFYWENPYGGWMCCGCHPRPNPKMIRRTVTVLVEEGSEKQIMLFEPVPMERWRSDVAEHERAKQDARMEMLHGAETF